MQEVRFFIERVEKNENEKDVPQGAWFSLPLNYEEVAEKFDIHSNIEDEEFDVVEAEGIPFDYVCGYCTISEMNELYDKWLEIPFYITNYIEVFMEHFNGFDDLYEKHTRMWVYMMCYTMEDVAKDFVRRGEFGDINSMLIDCIDYEKLGEKISSENKFVKTDAGMVNIP